MHALKLFSSESNLVEARVGTTKRSQHNKTMGREKLFSELASVTQPVEIPCTLHSHTSGKRLILRALETTTHKEASMHASDILGRHAYITQIYGWI